jgi:hypothetical protein
MYMCGYVYVWMSAIMLLLIFTGFENLPVQGRCCRIFLLISFENLPVNFFCINRLVFLFTEKILVFLAAAGLSAPRPVATAPTRHSPTSLTPPPP